MSADLTADLYSKCHAFKVLLLPGSISEHAKRLQRAIILFLSKSQVQLLSVFLSLKKPDFSINSVLVRCLTFL